MQNETRYRLGRYILTDCSNVVLMWATNTAFGGQRTGHCLIIDNILVLLPWEQKETGYLRLEFHINQARLSAWKKTRYYCFSSDIRQTGVHQSLARHELEQLSPSGRSRPVSLEGAYAYRLGRYKITTDEDKGIAWRTAGECDRIIGGDCMIESGILFLGPKEHEFEQGQRRLFYNELKLLPEWNATRAWGHQESLLMCENPEREGSAFDIWDGDRLKACMARYIPFLNGPETQAERGARSTVK